MAKKRKPDSRRTLAIDGFRVVFHRAEDGIWKVALADGHSIEFRRQPVIKTKAKYRWLATDSRDPARPVVADTREEAYILVTGQYDRLKLAAD